MANPEHLEILKKGVEVWNEWREVVGEVSPLLTSIAGLSSNSLTRYEADSLSWFRSLLILRSAHCRSANRLDFQ